MSKPMIDDAVGYSLPFPRGMILESVRPDGDFIKPVESGEN